MKPINTRVERSTRRATAFTLLEVLLVFAILAVLIGLLVPAVQKIRMAALRTQVSNQIRQLSLAQQNYVSSQSLLPPAKRSDHSRGGGNVFWLLLPYLEAGAIEAPSETGLTIRNYISPADPSYAAFPSQPGNCSFAVNSLTCWYTGMAFPEEFKDGQSQTLLFAERYARCKRQNVIWSLGSVTCFNPVLGKNVPCGLTVDRRATFADKAFIDVLPIPGELPDTTTGSVPGLTYQVAPNPSECDGRIVQSTFPSGLIVGMADASVHTLNPGIVPTVFWAMTTPAGGEILGDW